MSENYTARGLAKYSEIKKSATRMKLVSYESYAMREITH